MVKRAYKYRFYPTPEQKQILAQTFGHVRYIWNWALRYRTEAYHEGGERLFSVDMSAKLTALKKEPATCWLSEVSSVPLQQTLRHQDQAFRNFFEGRAGYPVFKKKRNQQSATYAKTAFSWNGEDLKLAKMSEPLDIRWSRSFKGDPSTVVISKDSANRYFVSFLVEEKIKPFQVSRNPIGLDLGLTNAVITSEGHKFGNPQFFRKDEQKLAKAQRNLSRKQKGSKNRDKARLKVARIHARIQDRRNDFLHKLTTALIRENQVVCAESLNVKGMLRNHHLAKSISDVGWGELVRQLEYKALWYGRRFVRIDTFYPSSKRCSQCGHILESLPLSVRSWRCPECGKNHDRDVNAAVNIKAAGLAVLACGEAIRPSRAKAKARALPGVPRRSRKPEGASL